MEVDGTMDSTLKLFSTTINVRRDQFGSLITFNYLGDIHPNYFLFSILASLRRLT